MKLNCVLVLVATAAVCVAGPTYTGYSGAPGSQDACAGGCHGTSGGTITVSGFPTTYTPGQAYVITVGHNGGSTIQNFNASIRVGTGSTNAGTITAGTNTATYNVPGETNGVHFGTAVQESGTFTWTAPSSGVGDVTLYIAGLQGTKDGPQTALVVTAQGAGIAETGRGPVLESFRLEQSVVTNHFVMRIDNPQASARIRIIDRNGRIVGRLVVAAGSNQAIAWPPLDSRGRKLAAGSYYVAFVTPGTYRVAKFTVVVR